MSVNPTHGDTVVDTATGAITYTPTPGYSGPDTYTYRVCDTSTPAPVCDVATVTISVGANTVVATPDSDTTTPETPVSTDVRSNDSSSTGQALANPAVTVAPLKGATAVDPDTGAITYTPSPGTSGVDTYTYRVCDTSTPTPVCAAAPVTITVVSAVTAAADTAATPQNVAVTTAVLTNDTFTTGGAPLNPASVTVITAPDHGTTTVTDTGSVTYTPNADFSGTDGYQYRVCDTSSPTPVCDSATVSVNVRPNVVVAVDDAARTAPVTAVVVPVTANDTVLSNGAALDLTSVVITTAAGFGTTDVDLDTGDITYLPAANRSGTDVFTYRVCDLSTPTPICDTATVTVDVPNEVTAVDDADTTAPLTPVTTHVLGNDTVVVGGAPLNPASVTVTVNPQHGVTSVDNATGAVTYRPNGSFSGTDSYGYRVCDISTPTPVCDTATVTLSIPNLVSAADDEVSTPQNTAATTRVLANDGVTPGGSPLDPTSVTIVADAAHGTLLVHRTACETPQAPCRTGDVTYTPDVGYSGSDGYDYRVCDVSTPTPICASATVSISVGRNTVSASSDIGETPPVTPIDIDVRANDSTATGQPLDLPTVTTPPDHGAAVIQTDAGDRQGFATYTPDPLFSGIDSFEYQVCDTSHPTPVCAITTVVITVPNPFVPADDDATTPQNSPVAVDVLANDSLVYPQGAPLNPASVTTTTAQHGTTVVDELTGSVTYTPALHYTGPDTFQYTVCDTSVPTPACDSATVTITVGPNIVLPVDDAATTLNNLPVELDILGNDGTATGGAPLDPTTVTVIIEPAHGAVTVDPTTGNVVYTPNAGYAGPDLFTYQVCDISVPTTVCAAARVDVTVLATGLDLAKRATVTDVNGDGLTSVGDTISYTFVVINIGQVTATGIRVIDDKAGDVICTATELAVGSETTCAAVATHSITEADSAAGVVINSAYATATGTCPPPADFNSCRDTFDFTSEVRTAVSPVSTDAQLTVIKNGYWVDVNDNGIADTADRVSWTITVLNPGTAGVSDLVVSDPAAGTVECASTTLSAGAGVECTVPDHAVTEGDLGAGSVSNTATASGRGPAGPVGSLPSTAVVTLPSSPSLPTTGFALDGYLRVALLLTLAGAALARVGRRRPVEGRID